MLNNVLITWFNQLFLRNFVSFKQKIDWIWSCNLSNAKQNLKNNAIVRNEFATNANQDNRFDQVAALQQKRPAASLKKKIQLDNVMSDNAMISIYPLGNKYYCFYYLGSYHHFYLQFE